MADFPDLEPAARSFTLGEYPLSLQKAWGLNAIPMRHGPAPAACQLTLTYEQISSSQATLIRNHYANQRGELLPFALSIAVFDGNSNPPRGPWKYSSPPQETHLDGGLVDVTVQLISALA
jgi:hypothetical protein